MDTLILSKFTNATSQQRAQWIATAPQFIRNDTFINLLNTIDINEKKPWKTIRLVAKFSVAYGTLLEDAKKWLSS